MSDIPAPFDPDWTVPPGETLRETLQEVKVGVEAFARWAGLPLEWVEGFLRGEAELTDAYAQALEDTTCIPKRLWTELERIYREGLAAGKIVVRSE